MGIVKSSSGAPVRSASGSPVTTKKATAAGEGTGSGATSGGLGPLSVNAGPNGVSIAGTFSQSVARKAEARNRTTGPLKKLYQNKTVKTLIFPLDLDDEHYIIYNAVDRRRPQRDAWGTKNTTTTIVLPIPSNLATGYQAQYNNKSLGAFGAMAAGRVGADDLQQASTDLSKLVSDKIDGAVKAIQTGDTDALATAAGILGPGAAALAGGVIGGPLLAALGAAGSAGQVLSGLGVREGLALNPHMATLFEGVGFREHNFTYNFIARNSLESRMIRKIINAFKWHMHPNMTAGTLAFEYPQEFTIEFAEAIQPWLYKMESCVLKSFNVTYNGENTPLFFETTGAPVSIQIQLGFQETKILTKDDLDNLTADDYTIDELGPT